MSIFSILSSTSGSNSDMDDLKQKEIDNGNYEFYNFEEEDLEDDDYYFEDDE